MPKLELFYKDTCPYCQKVLRYMDEHDVKVDALLDVVGEPANKERLVEVGGKGQVPCLFIDGEPMYESGDIIAYFAKTFKLEASAEETAKGGACRLDGTGCN